MRKLVKWLILLVSPGLLSSAPREGLRVAGWEVPQLQVLSPAPGEPVDVFLEDPRIELHEDGLRVLSFRLALDPRESRGFMFLVDPLAGNYRTVNGIPGEGGRGVWDGEAIRPRLDSVDWSRLPRFLQTEPARRGLGRGSRGGRVRESPAGLIWAEARTAPGPAPEEEDEGGSDSCPAAFRISMQSLDSEFVPLAQTSAGLLQPDPDPRWHTGGTCWARSGRGPGGWSLTRCQPIPVTGANCGSGQFARFAQGDPGVAVQETVMHGVAIEHPPCSDQNGAGVLVQADFADPGALFLGAVILADGCR